MYELIILSLLTRKSAHGYLIAKIINDMFGPYTRISNGRLYPLLNKLEAEGFIAAHNTPSPAPHSATRNARQFRSFLITERGSQRLHQLLMDTTSNPGEYQRIFHHKATILSILHQDKQLYLIDHYINYCQAHILHVTAESEDLTQRGPEYMDTTWLHSVLNVMHHTKDQWQLELEWARALRQETVDQQQKPQQETLSDQKTGSVF